MNKKTVDDDAMSVEDLSLGDSSSFAGGASITTAKSGTQHGTVVSSSSSSGQQLFGQERESSQVAKWRLGVITMLLGTAALVVTSTYLFLNRVEHDNFETAFAKHAKTLQGALENQGDTISQTLSSFGDMITSETMQQQHETHNTDSMENPMFPLLADFEIKAAHARLSASVEFLAYAPIITSEQRMAWEGFSRTHQSHWIPISRAQSDITWQWFYDSFGPPMDMSSHGGDHHGEGHGEDHRDGKMGHGAGMDHGYKVGQEGGGDNMHHGHDNMGKMGNHTMNDTSDHDGNQDEMGANGNMMMNHTDTMHGNQTSEKHEGAMEDLDNEGEGEGGMPGMNMANHGRSLMEEDMTMDTHAEPSSTEAGIYPHIYTLNDMGHPVPVGDNKEYAPVWQVSPAPMGNGQSLVNFDLLSQSSLFSLAELRHGPVISDMRDLSWFYSDIMQDDQHWIFHRGAHDFSSNQEHTANSHPHCMMLSPIRSGFGAEASNSLVGVVFAAVPIDLYMSNLLPDGVNGLYAIVKNSCGQAESYEINGSSVTYIGSGEKHDLTFSSMKRSATIGRQKIEVDGVGCVYTIDFFPSKTFQDAYVSNQPALFTAGITFVFLLTGFIFFTYTYFVQRRQRRLMYAAQRTNAVVASLFPSNVRKQILEQVEAEVEIEVKKQNHIPWLDAVPQKRLRHFLEGKGEDKPEDATDKSKPIADFFPEGKPTARESIATRHWAIFPSRVIMLAEVTVMFADLVGFTAWSSVREPSQVFLLLETVFQAFDVIAKRRRIFKVETVGDCYVAVTGLPEKRADHAIAMSRFATDCLAQFRTLTQELEKTLGPDTGDLNVRIGIHSGPVTAGVLRGEKARFQLFGDTMNTAARMEQTSRPGKIQLSHVTADILRISGKEKWLVQRGDIEIKGKGKTTCFWLDISGALRQRNTAADDLTFSEHLSISNASLAHFGRCNSSHGVSTPMSTSAHREKLERLVDWNVDTLMKLLKQIQGRRLQRGELKQSKVVRHSSTSRLLDDDGHPPSILDEVSEIIMLPQFDNDCSNSGMIDISQIQMDPFVEKELRDFVHTIALMYRDNAFHNFEHASHVAMSVNKLLSRIVRPSDLDLEEESGDMDHGRVASALHDHTYGITSDPLTQFSCVFSALIHDVDHQGVGNPQLVKENALIAQTYRGRSVAEQNSVALSWELLFADDRYIHLRHAIYEDEEEKKRFRKLVVNSVMATDIMDADLKTLRNKRWERAFKGDLVQGEKEDARHAINRKATIVIEHLIQASDVAHTMQHWNVYRKWNERLFRELYIAYKHGRAEKDPSDFWYQGEIGFFDFYIIPLARKLEECGVFGVSSVEYLGYAQRNREAWVLRGREVVEEMKEKLLATLPVDAEPSAVPAPQATTTNTTEPSSHADPSSSASSFENLGMVVELNSS